MFKKTEENQCKKTYPFKTQCKGYKRRGSKTTKITVFEPVICKTSDVHLQDELLY